MDAASLRWRRAASAGPVLDGPATLPQAHPGIRHRSV